jgi:toxin YhaV
MIVINGWGILAHPLFLDQIERLASAVEGEREKNPITYKDGANAKLLKAISALAFEIIPEDPTRKEYRQGSTLGEDLKHWFRGKCGNGRYRIFFRFHGARRLIIYAWVNDSDTKRTRGSKSDAYVVFRKMLKKGNPPDNWDALHSAACDADSIKRLARAHSKPKHKSSAHR